MRGVTPLAVSASMSAPRSWRSRQQATWPWRAAKCKGVRPLAPFLPPSLAWSARQPVLVNSQARVSSRPEPAARCVRLHPLRSRTRSSK